MEHRLTLRAEGYETFTRFFSPDELASGECVDIALVRSAGATEQSTGTADGPATPTPDTLHGQVLHDGAPVTDGWLRVEIPIEERDTWNVCLIRGCPVPVGTGTLEQVAIAADGSFELRRVHPGFAYLVADVPGLPLQVKAIEILPRETWPDGRPEFRFETLPAGEITGSVSGVPPAMRGRLWVVAFDDAVVRRAVRTCADDTFEFSDLPAGRYGIRVGHDAWSKLQGNYPEIFPADEENPITAEPWIGIDPIQLEPGAVVDGIEVRFGAP